jgi:hypothetical protein
MNRPSQKMRWLKELKAAGSAGVEATAFLAPDVCDGGKPILRSASRITELRQAGHHITSKRQPNGTALYVLDETKRTAPDAPEPPRLLEAQRRPPVSPYDLAGGNA